MNATATAVKTYANHNTAAKAAVKALGVDAVEGLAFNVAASASEAGRFEWAEVVAVPTKAPRKAKAKKEEAADMVQVGPNMTIVGDNVNRAGLHDASNKMIGQMLASEGKFDQRTAERRDGVITLPTETAHSIVETAHNVAVLADKLAAEAHSVENAAVALEQAVGNGNGTHEAVLETDKGEVIAKSVGNNVMLAGLAQLTQAPVVAPVKVAKAPKAASIIQNNVRKPGPGLCLDVWNACQEVLDKTGSAPDSKAVKAIAETKGWNPNNASIEFYQWRKFTGISSGARVATTSSNKPSKANALAALAVAQAALAAAVEGTPEHKAAFEACLKAASEAE